jgi:protein-S-isoprenylcysteine O-methyltransferase Ste14
MRSSERWFNTVFGLNVLAWAVLGVVHEDPAGRLSVVRVGIACLNVVVAVLLLLRRDAIRHAGTNEILWSLPSLVICGFAFKLSPAPADWPWYAESLFAAGVVLAVTSFLFLGRDFAVLPALRGVRVRGPYRWIRHPAYLGELTMVSACFLAGPTYAASIPAVAIVPAVVARVLVEESLLREAIAYRSYMRSVRWRILPGLW